MTEPARERKRRKWDVAAPTGVPTPSNAASGINLAGNPPAASAPPAAVSGPPSADVIARAKLGAMSVLEKINQDLRAKGAPQLRTNLRPQDDLIKREVTINDAPGPIRFHLTKRSTQDDVARRTGTEIVVRGQYTPPGAPRDPEEPPLFLKITPGLVSNQPEHLQQRAVDAAAAELEQILQGGQGGANPGRPSPGSGPHQQPYRPQLQPYGQPGYHPRPGGGAPPQHFHPPPQQQTSHQGNAHSYQQQPAPVVQGPRPLPLYIGIDPPPEFNAAGRLRGPGDGYLRHIAAETKTQVVLRGRGSGVAEGPEPLHILITGSSQKEIDEAAGLAKNLIDTVREEFKRAYPYAGQAPPQGSNPHPYPAGSQPAQAAPPYAQQGPQYGQYPPGHPPQPASYPMPYPQQGPPATYGAAPGGYYPAGVVQNFPPQQGARPSAHGPAMPGYPQQPQGGPYSHHQPQQHLYSAGAPQAYGGRPQLQHPSQPPQQQVQPQATQQNPGLQQNPGVLHPPASQPERSQTLGSEGMNNGEQTERKRRFKEFKETTAPVPAMPAPYAPQPMGPPPPRKPSPGQVMGPPPPRVASAAPGGGAKADPSNVSGSLAGLVDYE